LLAAEITVICADLRGYGESSCPLSSPDHEPYSKRAMAQDMVTVMGREARKRAAVRRAGRRAHVRRPRRGRAQRARGVPDPARGAEPQEFSDMTAQLAEDYAPLVV
jgi:haloacetate dehalogenase